MLLFHFWNCVFSHFLNACNLKLATFFQMRTPCPEMMNFNPKREKLIPQNSDERQTGYFSVLVPVQVLQGRGPKCLPVHPLLRSAGASQLWGSGGGEGTRSPAGSCCRGGEGAPGSAWLMPRRWEDCKALKPLLESAPPAAPLLLQDCWPHPGDAERHQVLTSCLFFLYGFDYRAPMSFSRCLPFIFTLQSCCFDCPVSLCIPFKNTGPGAPFKPFALALANLASLCFFISKKAFCIPISSFCLCAILVSGTFPEEFVLSCWASQSSQPGKDPEVSHICSEQSSYPWLCYRYRAPQKCWESVKTRFLRRLSLLLQSQPLPGDGAQGSPQLDPAPLPAAAWQHCLG